MVDTYLASNDFAGDGVTTLRTISFMGNRPDAGFGAVPYISPNDVKAVEVTPATATEPETEVPLTVTYVGPTQFNVTPATPIGKICRVYRATQDEYNLVDFNALQSINDSDLDLANRQSLFLVQEAHDKALRAATSQDSLALNLQHVLRTSDDEPAIPELPDALERANKVLGFDSGGNPIVVVASGSASQLELDLADGVTVGMGASKVGLTGSTTVRDGFNDLYDDTDPAKGAALIGMLGSNLSTIIQAFYDAIDPAKGAGLIGIDGSNLYDVIHNLYNDGTPNAGFGPALIKWFFNATGAEAITQYAKNAEEISVAVFGVTGIGDDTAAMIEAINWANSQRVTFNPTIGGGGGSAIVKAPVLTIPHNWTVQVQGNLPLPPILVAKGRACIQSLDNAKDIFVGPDTYMTYMSDIVFLHGRAQVVVQNANINAGLWLWERCTFEGSNDFAVKVLNTSGSYPVTSSQPILNECRWIRCKRALWTQADHTFVCGGWMQPEGDFFDTNTAFIRTDGMLSINMVMTIPGGTFPAKSRWIDNYGAVRCFQVRFGGEGGGIPCVYHFAPPNRYVLGDAQNRECGISFLQCTLYGGNAARADAAIVYLKGELPNIVRITDCTGPITTAWIRNEPSDGGIANITTYIANLKIAWSGDNMFNELSYHYTSDKSKYSTATTRWPAELDAYTYVNGERVLPWRIKLQNTVAQTALATGATTKLTTPTIIADPYGLIGDSAGVKIVTVPQYARWATVHGYVEIDSHSANNLLYLLRVYHNNTPVVDGTARYPHSATGIPGIHTFATFPCTPGSDIDIRFNHASGGDRTANVVNITVTFE